MKLKKIALSIALSIAPSLLLTSTAYADDVYIYSWETSQGGRTDAIQKMYSSNRGMVMEDTDSGRNGAEVVILSEGIMIMNDANERSSMVLDPDNVPSISDLISGAGGRGNNAGNTASNSVTSAEISAALEEAGQQYQQALQDMTPEEREMMNDLLNGGGQIQQQMQEAYAQAMAEATPEERQAVEDLFGQGAASDLDGILNNLGGLFGGGNSEQPANNNSQSDSGGLASAIGGLLGGGGDNQSSNDSDSQANSGGISSRLGGLFGGGRRDSNRSQQSTADAAEEASASVSSALSNLGGLFGGRNKELEGDQTTAAATANDIVEKDSNLLAGLGNLLGGQSSPPQFTETGNSGRDNGMRWDEVRMSLAGSTSTYRMVNVRDIDGGDQLIRHYETMSNIFNRMMNNMGLGGLAQGIGLWPQEISDYMSQNRKFPIYIEQGRTITRLVDVERGRIDDSRFGAQFPIQSMF